MLVRDSSRKCWKFAKSSGPRQRMCDSMQAGITTKAQPDRHEGGNMKSASLIFSAAVLAIVMDAAVGMAAEPAAGATPTFNKDVPPILFNNCEVCQRRG